MIRMSLIKKFIPFDVYADIYKIDYNKLYEEGRKIILFDLDNTIISYKVQNPCEKAVDLFKKLKDMGFIVVLISNNYSKRVDVASQVLEVYGLAKAKKPLKMGYKRIMKKYDIKDKREVIAIGDQILTDVFGGQRIGIDVILCNAILNDGEKWYTKMNRNLENRIIEKIAKVNAEVYGKIKNCRGNHDKR